MPSHSCPRPSLSRIHTALSQLGYQLVAQIAEMRWYQHQEHSEISLFLDFSEFVTFEDLTETLTKNGENPDAFFAMYESI